MATFTTPSNNPIYGNPGYQQLYQGPVYGTPVQQAYADPRFGNQAYATSPRQVYQVQAQAPPTQVYVQQPVAQAQQISLPATETEIDIVEYKQPAPAFRGVEVNIVPNQPQAQAVNYITKSTTDKCRPLMSGDLRTLNLSRLNNSVVKGLKFYSNGKDCIGITFDSFDSMVKFAETYSFGVADQTSPVSFHNLNMIELAGDSLQDAQNGRPLPALRSDDGVFEPALITAKVTQYTAFLRSDKLGFDENLRCCYFVLIEKIR